MKRLMTLLQCMLADASMWCRTSSTRDLRTVTRRFEHEGLSFLTITLPNFCKDFEKSLAEGKVSPSAFAGFAKTGELPRFLGGYLDLVFDRKSGLVRDVPCVHCIFFVRQLSLVCKKILLPCTEDRENAAFSGYIACEKEVRAWEESVGQEKLNRFSCHATLLFGTALSHVEAILYARKHVPKHGPGSTADRLIGNNKFDKMSWPIRLEEYFPSEDFLIPNHGFQDNLQNLTFLEPGAEQPVRVISVPKTLKTPRIIAVEPTSMQYAQQSILEILVDALEGNSLQNALGFTDQGPNQVLAQSSSIDGNHATLDLSEASDRVSNRLVRAMLSNFPNLNSALQSCRSTQADVPGHGIVPVAKFASMGSAVCFPVEAMAFLVAASIGYENSLHRSLTRKDVFHFLREVRIFGDDIIVPTGIVHSVIGSLSDYGFKVNLAKSFWTGKFRESCGGDFYDGVSVKPVYLRRLFPTSHRDVAEMVSLYSFRNQIYFSGLWQTARYLDTILEGLAPHPVVSTQSPALGRHSYLGYQVERVCRHLHRPLVRAYVVSVKHRKSRLKGFGALLKFFLKRGSQPIFDEKHLERYGRPECVDIKIRWAPSS